MSGVDRLMVHGVDGGDFDRILLDIDTERSLRLLDAELIGAGQTVSERERDAFKAGVAVAIGMTVAVLHEQGWFS